MRLARLDRRVIPELLEPPGRVVPLHERGHGGAYLLKILKDAPVDHLLLERAIPPLRHAVGFRFLDKSVAGADAPVPDLVEEVVRQVLAAVIHPQCEPPGDVGVECAIEAQEPLRDRLERREAAPDLTHMPPHALRVPVLDGREDPDPPGVPREHPHAVGPPHHVRRRRDDRPVVHRRGALASAVRGEQPVRPHDPQHPRARDADPVQDPQPRVDLPMALALERRPLEIGADRRQQRLVRHLGRRPPPRGRRTRLPRLRAGPPGVERRARALPGLTDALDPVASPRGRGGRRAHRRDLRIAKGRRCSAARARARSSSFSIDSSPM